MEKVRLYLLRTNFKITTTNKITGIDKNNGLISGLTGKRSVLIQ